MLTARGEEAATNRPARATVPLVGWAFLAVLYAMVVWVTAETRVQWGPDTAFHLAWTYRLLGDSEPEAVRRAVEFLADEQGIDCATSTLPWCHAENYQMYFSGDYAATVGPRVMTRLLSALLVAAFGPWAMVGLSIAAYAAGVVCLVLLANRMFGPRWAVLAGALTITPWLAANWAVHANTEALALAFTTASLLALPLRRARPARRDVLWFAALLALGLFTRQFAISVTAGTILAWLAVAVRDRRLRNPWLGFAGAAVVTTGLVVWVQGRMTASYASGFSTLETYERNTGTHGLGEVIASLPGTAGRILVGDLRHVRTDLVLAVVLCLAAVSVCWRFRSELSALVLGMFATTLALNLIINSDSVFRYHTPNYPAYALAAVALLTDLAAQRRPSRATESVPLGAPPGAPPASGAVPVSWWVALVGGYLAVVLTVRTLDLRDAAVGAGPALAHPPAPEWPGSALPILAYGAAVGLVAWLAVRLWGRWGILAGALMLVPTVIVPLARPSFHEPFAALAVAAALCTLPWPSPSPPRPHFRLPFRLQFRLHAQRAALLGGNSQESSPIPVQGVRGDPSPLWGWGRGRVWWFGAAILLATLVDDYASVVVAGVLVAWATSVALGEGWPNRWTPYPLAGIAAVAAALGIRTVWRVRETPIVVDWTSLGSDLMLVAVVVLIVVAGLRLWRDQPAVPLAMGALAAAVVLSRIDLSAIGLSHLDPATGLRPVTALMPLLALAATATATALPDPPTKIKASLKQ
ncbi:glycosyltransferase family 39 protein [Actinomycetes bacterium KLBMP 9797]